MRRLICVLSLFFLAIVQGYGQAWEKYLAPGLTYRMEVDTQLPRVVHAFRVSLGSDKVSMRSEVAAQRVFGIPEGKGREELSAMISRTGAVGGINGDFFPFTGDPLGAMVRDGELVSKPDERRAVFGWGPKHAAIGKLKWTAAIRFESGETMPIQGINEECGENALTLNTRAAALAKAKSPCIYLPLILTDPRFGPNATVAGSAGTFAVDMEEVPVAANGAVLAAKGTRAEALGKIKPGTRFTIEVRTTGFDWTKITNVMSGGPMLVRTGSKFIDWESSGFGAAFANNRHPRTAVGRTKDGDLWLVTVDGRQTMSSGATLAEMADLMLSLGCDEAVNLDGGGSTTIAMLGSVLNRPSDGVERKISNAVLLFAPALEPAEGALVIAGPKQLPLTGIAQFRVLGADGQPVQNQEILWSATGDAWIDQGGNLRPIKAGKATIIAAIRGKRTTLEVAVGP